MRSKRFPRWYLPLRLISFGLLTLASLLWLRLPVTVLVPLIAYALATLALATVTTTRAQRSHRLTSIALTAQLLTEVILIAAMVAYSGGVQSPLTPLFVLSILSAALAYRMAGTLGIASAASAAYAVVVWFGLMSPDQQSVMPSWRGVLASEDQLFYPVFLQMLLMYLVAFVAGYFAERLWHQDQRLLDTSRALHRARLETDDILRHLTSGLLSVDAEGKLIFFNKSAERILGYSEEIVRGRHCEEVFHDRMPEFAEVLMDGVAGRLEHPRREIEITDSTGVALPVGLSTSVLTESDGTVRGVISIFSDLTEAKELEAKVRVADRLAAVGELSASIAHEIRNPLAAISGSVEVLQGELLPTGENARLMSLIVKESDRLTDILNQFLTYARIDQPQISPLAIDDLIGELFELVRHHDHYHPAIALQMHLPAPIPTIVSDETLLRQLLLNLLLNACEAIGREAGTVSVRLLPPAEGSSDRWRLEIVDTGPGMDDKIRQQLFQPFFSTKRGGTGLGLAIVHRIATSLQLAIDVDNHPDGGARFTLDLAVTSDPIGDETKESAERYAIA